MPRPVDATILPQSRDRAARLGCALRESIADLERSANRAFPPVPRQVLDEGRAHLAKAADAAEALSTTLSEITASIDNRLKPDSSQDLP